MALRATKGDEDQLEGASSTERFLADKYRDLLHDLDAEPFQRHDLARMIGQQPDGVQPQIGKNLRADAAFVLQLRLPGGAGIVHEIARRATPYGPGRRGFFWTRNPGPVWCR